MQVFTCIFVFLVVPYAMETIDLTIKALADSNRRTLLDKLYDKSGQTLGELCENMEMSRQAVTQHLAVLEKANLLTVLWRGREKLHYFNPVPIHEFYERWIRKFEQPRLNALYDLKHKMEGGQSA